jgi:hypothetical protein
MQTQLTPTIIAALKAARFYGYPRAREGKVCAGSTDEVICSPAAVNALVQRGWLKPWLSRHEISREGEPNVAGIGGQNVSGSRPGLAAEGPVSIPAVEPDNIRCHV